MRHLSGIMATASLSPELSSMDLFRAAITPEAASPDTINRLCAVGRYRALKRLEQLPTHSSEDRLVFVAHGSAKLVALPAQTGANDFKQAATQPLQCQVLAFHFPGDIVSVLRQSAGDLRLVALGDVDCIVFETDQFLNVAQDDPTVIRAVLSRSLEALDRSRGRMMQMGHKSARQRIADFLVSMAERVCGCVNGECLFDLPMSRRDIGDSLGLTIETVSRQFADLRGERLIETSGRSQIRIISLDALSQLSGRP